MSERQLKYDRRAYTRKELAAMYCVSSSTFVRWLKRLNINIEPRKLITPKQVDKIFDLLGEP